MIIRVTINKLISLLFLLSLYGNSQAQERPDLLFREDWKESPAEIPLSQDHVMNDKLVVHLYGPGRDSLKKSHHDQPLDDPYYVWSGLCIGNWAVAIEHKERYADLSGLSKIRWRSKQFGFRQLHIIVKLSDGTWLVSEQADGPSKDWRVTEFNVSDLKWRKLHIDKVIEGTTVDEPDLSKIEQIGFTDLMQGGRSAACSRLDWIEVHAFSVKK